MFTGIIVALGRVRRVSHEGIAVDTEGRLPVPLRVGGSLAVNGVCLTVVRVRGSLFEADLSPETRRRTALGRLRPGDRVNLEPPLAAGAPLDGHFVQGHVDTVGEVLAIRREGEGGRSHRFTFAVEPTFDRYLVEKGSVAVDGISLTAFDVAEGRFSVAVIPHTFEVTNLHLKAPGDPVNVEFDILGKYVEKLVQAQAQVRVQGGEHVRPDRSGR